MCWGHAILGHYINCVSSAIVQFMIGNKPRNTGLPQWCQTSENQYGTVRELEED